MGIKARYPLLIGAFVAYAVMLVGTFAVSEIKTKFEPSYGVNADHFTIQVEKYSYITDEEVTNVVREIGETINGTNSTLIYEGMVPGIGLYDPNGFFSSYDLTEGSYFHASDFGLHSAPVALIKNGTLLSQHMRDNKTLINGQLASVRGVYDNSYQLSNNPSRSQNEYIYPFLSAISLKGTYYIWNTSTSTISLLTDIFHSYGYEATFKLHTVDTNVGVLTMFLQTFLSKRLLSYMVIGMLFIYYNSFFTYYVLISRLGRIANINFMVGATRSKVFAKIIQRILPILFIGSLLGGAACILFLLKGGIDIYPLPMLGICLVNVLVNALIFSLAYLIKSFWWARGMIS